MIAQCPVSPILAKNSRKEEIKFFTWKLELVSNIFWMTVELRKIPEFQLISWCGNFAERHRFRKVSGDSPKTMRKLCLSTKFSHQKIMCNYGILRSVTFNKNNISNTKNMQTLLSIIVHLLKNIWYTKTLSILKDRSILKWY